MKEIEKESPVKPSNLVRKVKASVQEKLRLADQYSHEIQANIKTNAEHFFHCLEMIPLEKQAEIKTSQELIEALNKVAREENKPLFFRQGETIDLKIAFYPQRVFKIVGIFSNVKEGWHLFGETFMEGKIIHLSGTNFFDNEPTVGSRFIPCEYFLEYTTASNRSG